MSDLLKYVKKNEGKNVYIFGVCERGKSIYRYLNENGISVKGFLISEAYKKEDGSIFYLKEIDVKNALVILAVKYRNFNVLIPQFVKAGISNIYFLDGKDDQVLDYYNTYFTNGKDISEMYPNRWRTYDTAKKIFEHIAPEIQVHSAIDFGCGSGAWLKAFKDVFNAEKVLGLDETIIDRSEFLEPNEFEKCDLSKYVVSDNCRYDMAISIEVAEHLKEDKADLFVDNLCKASDIILFSAAIMWQGGDYHVNEQNTSYWVKKFKERGYEYVDCIRNKFWNNKEMVLHCRQNCVLYVKKDKLGNIKEHLDKSIEFVDYVHPELYDLKMQAVQNRIIY